MMPVGERALRAARREVAPQPLPLRRRIGSRQVAVQRDDVPRAQLEAVVTETSNARLRSEVFEVGRPCGIAVVLMIARHWPRSAFLAAPHRVVTVPILTRRSAEVGVVA